MKRKTTAMNEKELIGKVRSALYHQCQQRGYAALKTQPHIENSN
ncbi:hypothetical protein [Blautia liquoris]|nr:hypothetical protein [Blautia liquoris]